MPFLRAGWPQSPAKTNRFLAYFLGKQNANSHLLTGVAGRGAAMMRSHIGTTLA
jgi:hypothetical protein